VGRLSVGERQRVEITKALYRGARILILDEPTAVLTPQESEDLFAVLTRMVQQGLSIIFISHKLAEVLRVAQRVAVLRGGKLVAQAAAQHTTQAQLAQWMVGHAVHAPQRHPARQTGGEVCAMQHISTAPARERLHRVCLRLQAGEIVAIAGVSGNGQVALAEVLCGTRRTTHGTLQWQGQPYPHQPAALVQRGIAHIPEDRHGQGLIGDLPVWENAVSERLRSGLFSCWGWVRRRAARAYAQQLLARFDVRGAGIDSNARLLSGGNMQKLIVGRALLHPLAAGNNRSHNPQLIIAHQPTWGLDIGAVAFVHKQLLAARDAGAAVLLISDDLDEVLALGDRVAVMHAGQLTATRPAADWSRQQIGLAMAGAQELAALQEGAA
ncbi:MAG: ATP-binding cassette domain-containing protein, partial [Rhodoferax sp.]|nr:ATP-binding cassette domain-containing protein [Rhodoferax sp.]